MTEENGLNSIMIYDKAINSSDFIDFLRQLRRKYYGRSLALFMDQLPVHKST